MQPPSRKGAIFLDRDGVINENRDDYVKSWVEFNFLPGALAALKQLGQSPFPIIVVTNQSAVGRGILTVEALEKIHARMRAEVCAHGGRIDCIVYCPHHPEMGCACRKPKPGLLIRAAERLRINPARSYFVGDALSDVQAGLAAGCQSLLVLTGRGAAAKRAVLAQHADHCKIVPDLAAATRYMLARLEGACKPDSNFFIV